MILWSKLPKKDKKHLREIKIFTKYQFEEQVKHMKEMEKEHPNFLCWECRGIAIKLRMWED